MLKTVLCLASLLGVGAPLLAQSLQPVSVPASPNEQGQVWRNNATANRNTNATVRVPARSSSYSWMPFAGQWSPQAVITTSVYNAQGQVISAVSADSATQQPLSRKTYTRNPAGITASYVEEQWTGSAWQNSTQWLNTLDAQGNLTEQLQQQWLNGAWSTTDRVVQAFDSHNKLTLFQRYRLNNGSMIRQQYNEYAYVYDAQGLVQQVTLSTWDSGAGQLNPVQRETYTYTANTSSLASFTREERTSGPWLYTYKQDFAYDSQARTMSWQEYSWAGTWQPSKRSTRTLDAATASYVEVQQTPSGATWMNSLRRTSSTDALGTYLGSTEETWLLSGWALSYANIIVPRYNATDDIVVVLNRVTTAPFQSTPLTPTNTIKIYYSNFQSYILASRPAVKAAASWQHYPNPSTGRVTLAPAAGQAGHLRAAEVLNSLGQVVRQQRFSQATSAPPTLELGGLPAGIYTLRLQTDAGPELHRLQKE